MNKFSHFAQNRSISLNRLLAEPGDETGHLQLACRALHNTHMRHSDLFDKLELQVLRHRVGFANAKDVGDDVLRRVAKAPKTAHDSPEK